MAGAQQPGLVVVRVTVHVRPGASVASVGGIHDDALVVRVAQPAEGGAATRAVLRALAAAFGVPARAVTLARGATSRRKLVDIAVEPGEAGRIRERLEVLLS